MPTAKLVREQADALFVLMTHCQLEDSALLIADPAASNAEMAPALGALLTITGTEKAANSSVPQDRLHPTDSASALPASSSTWAPASPAALPNSST